LRLIVHQHSCCTEQLESRLDAAHLDFSDDFRVAEQRGKAGIDDDGVDIEQSIASDAHRARTQMRRRQYEEAQSLDRHRLADTLRDRTLDIGNEGRQRDDGRQCGDRRHKGRHSRQKYPITSRKHRPSSEFSMR